MLELRLAAIKLCSTFVLNFIPNLGYEWGVLRHKGRARGVGCGGGMRFWPLRGKTLVPHARALSGEHVAFSLFGQAASAISQASPARGS